MTAMLRRPTSAILLTHWNVTLSRLTNAARKSTPERKTMARTCVKLLAALAVLGAVPGVAGAQTSVVKIDGSSTVYPVTEAVAEEFQKAQKGAVKVTVGISGTGGGFKKFCRGETDISDASRPISKSEMEDCAKNGVQYMEMPVAYDALTVVVNPKNSFLSSITIEDLKKM